MSDRYQIQAKANNSAELLIYGDIGPNWFDDESVDAISVVRQLADMQGAELTVRINSKGGSLADAMAIYNAIKDHKGPTRTRIEGVAYSMGSLIAMAADQVEMAGNGLLMIHAPWVNASGNAPKLRELAENLDKAAEAMAGCYERPGVDSEKIAGWLSDGKDHFFTASEAQAAGLIDSLTETVDIAAALVGFQNVQLPDFTKEGNTVDKAKDKPADQGNDFMAEHKAAVNAGQRQGAEAEHRRQIQIQALFADMADPDGSLEALGKACLSDIKCTVADAQNRIIESLKGRTDVPISGFSPDQGAASPNHRPGRERGRITHDQVDKLIQGATTAMEIRAGLITDRETIQKETGSEFLSMSLMELGKHCMRIEGKDCYGSQEQVARRILGAGGGPGQGSDHFPAILENIANKSVMDGYMAAEETWQNWTQRGTLNDYRTASRVNKSLFDTLDKMEEYESFKHGRFADVKQSITGFLHGKSFSLTLQSLVNDDMGILTGDARAWGESANTTIGDAVFTVLTVSGTGGYGQTMDEDSTILFHADHSNYIASGSGAAPSAATIGAGRTAMMGQSDPNGRQVASRPRYLLHGTGLTMTVLPLLNSQSYITGADATMPDRNPVASLGIQSIEEYRIDDFVSTAWMLAAARRTVEVAFVGGQSTPQVFRMPPGEIPGVTWQISIPFGVAALDFRTLYFNYGA